MPGISPAAWCGTTAEMAMDENGRFRPARQTDWPVRTRMVALGGGRRFVSHRRLLFGRSMFP